MCEPLKLRLAHPPREKVHEMKRARKVRKVSTLHDVIRGVQYAGDNYAASKHSLSVHRKKHFVLL